MISTESRIGASGRVTWAGLHLLGVVQEDLGRAEADDETVGAGRLLDEPRVHGDLHGCRVRAR